jgi:glycerol-1-phosphate dehydrogenase [NAD(P)+]
MEISTPTLLRIKPNAIHKIGKYLRKEGFTRVALFYGEGLKELFSEHITISFDSSEITVIQEEIVVSNDIDNIFRQTMSIPGTVQAIVAIGGGKVIDFSKYAAFILQLPIISVPTSISNDGFASPGASLVVNGKRKSMKANIPYGVIIDTEVIKNSPERYTFSGIGDLISNYTAIYDWKLSYDATREYVNDFAVLISTNAVENMVNYKNKNIADLEFLRLICGCLVMSGVAMEVSRSSRPASGSEHLISHAYDQVAARPSLHGLQVGVATFAISWLQENKEHAIIKEVLEITGFIDYVTKNPLNREDFIKAIRHAPSIKENYYTVLSEKGKLEKLVNFVKTDDYFNRLVT